MWKFFKFRMEGGDQVLWRYFHNELILTFLIMDFPRSGFISLHLNFFFMENYHFSLHMAFWKESMINWLSDPINHNRSPAKISQVLCSNRHLTTESNFDAHEAC